jgi:hypothetical protein
VSITGSHYDRQESLSAAGMTRNSGTLRSYRALAQVRDHLAREGNPILADRLASIFLARAVQTNAVARGNKGCRQIPCQRVFFVINRAQLRHTLRLLRWVLRAVTVEAHNLPVARQPPGPVRLQGRAGAVPISPASPLTTAGCGRSPATHRQPGGWRAQGAHLKKSDGLEDFIIATDIAE